MLLPEKFLNDLFAPISSSDKDFFRGGMMKTDIVEKKDSYSLAMNLPGFTKDDIRAELKDGYLEISAEKKENKDEKDENGRFIRRERYFGSCKRRFYVGDIDETGVKAEFTDGVLKIDIPKEPEKIETAKCIPIGATEKEEKAE